LLLLLSLSLWDHLPRASFHMTPRSAHLSSLHPSYRHCIVHTTDGSPLSIAGQGTLSSASFCVPDVSLVPDLTMQLMSAGQITDYDCRVIQDRRTDHLVSLPVLSAPPLLLCPCHHLLSGTIV
jgi:hypothetical protein